MTHPNRVRMSKLTLGLLAAFATAPVFAQATSAGIGGRVVGADGAPVAGAEVVITHVESGTVSRAITGDDGRYNARGLRVGGPYTVVINKAGAGSSSQDGVYLNLDKVNQAIQGASDLEQMTRDVLDVVLSTFDVERAWLIYPCDADAPTWRVPFERTHPDWMTTDGDLWWVAEHLAGVRHTRLLSPALVRRLHRVDRRSLDAGLVGYRQDGRR